MPSLGNVIDGYSGVVLRRSFEVLELAPLRLFRGNSLQVIELIKRVRGIELRWYLGSAHYRSMLEFSFEALEESSVNFRRIEGFLQRAKEATGALPDFDLSDEFRMAMNDDLAVPTALADISELVKLGNTALGNNNLLEVARYASQVRGALFILGCDPFDEIFATGSTLNEELVGKLVELALEQRTEARARKDFAAADAIRDQIQALGIALEDTPQGVRWSVGK